jgi:hypothetical protein
MIGSMSRFLLQTLLPSLALLAAGGSLSAGIVDHPASFPAGQSCDCATSSFAPSENQGLQVFDNFLLQSPAEIQQVTWQGFYYDFVTAANNPTSPDTVSWTFQFWSDSSGLPGTLLYTQTLPTNQVPATFVGVDSTFNNVGVYDMEALLPTGFAASANTPYWFSVLSNQASINPLFSWTLGLNGDNLSYQVGLGSASSFAQTRPADRAFSLDTPEPASSLAALFGIALLAGLRRRFTSAKG